MSRTSDPNDIPERLIKSGLSLFLNQGYNGTGIKQITDHAGVPKGSFYNHFTSKEAFAAVIVDYYAENSAEAWQHMMASAPHDPMAAIRHVFECMLDHHQRASSPAGCLIGNFAAEIALSSECCRLSLIAAQQAWRDRLANLIEQAQQAGSVRTDVDAQTLSGTTWSVWEGALLRMKIERSTQPVQQSIALILDRLYPPPTQHARGFK
ncbi:TetR/AcrR family transcriptional regulator [Ketobacter alkanivorans]|uniref:TetR family transcriptional regulator n=1 Tax=Ketobacter alkanivorans TaxID=1917421 RepID=A0A2K9LRR9_9GAMM|nr:TetR/AcrR family transcriptional regulator [Ketobacter alkanivorans]AUM13524.1 TetR family transcriptional regulator [Ketobacter alkanivorans]